MSGSTGTSSSVDASIPLQAGRGVQQPANPLQTIGQFAETKNLLNQNALFPAQQQQLQLANQRSQIGLQSDQSGLIQQQRQLGAAALTPLLAKKGPLSLDDVTTALAGAEKSGVVTQPTLADFQGVQITGNPAVDDANIRAHILANSQPAASAAAAVTPQQGTVDVGPSIQPVTIGARGMPDQGQMAPAGGAYQKGLGPQFVNNGQGEIPTNNGQPVAAPIANQLSPAQINTPTQIGVGTHGEPIMGTLGQFLTKSGAASPLGTGRLPPALLNPANQPQGVVTGVGPAQQAQMAAQGTQSAHAFQDIADQGVQARGQNAVLGNMLGDISNFTPGPTGANNFKNWVVRNGAEIGSTFGIDPASVAANESFDKLANQIAGAQGERSDARLSVAQAANPGSHLSPAGADLILRQLQGNADYLQARANLASRYPNQTDRAGFEAQVGSTLDPRAFQYQRMTPAQRKTYAAGLSPQDLAAVRKSYNTLHGEGLLGGQ